MFPAAVQAEISPGNSVKKKGKCLLAGTQWLISLGLAKKKRREGKNLFPVSFSCIFVVWSFIFWRA